MNKKIFIIVLISLVLMLLTCLVTRLTAQVPLDRDEEGELYSAENPGGGVAIVDTKSGFPLNFIENPDTKPTNSINWLYFSLDYLFWIFVTAFVILGYQKRKS